ncbi:MAG: nucleotidyltransferase domain-containing protein [Patescibacteria group bacterium]
MSEVKEYKKILKADNLPITGVYVFGSYAKGSARKGSDIDVAVISPKFKNSWSALGYLYSKLPYGLGWTIEPVGFSPKEFNNKYSSLIYEIKTHGVKV